MVTHGLLGTYRGNMVQRGGRDCVWRYTRDHGGANSSTYGHGGQQQKKTTLQTGVRRQQKQHKQHSKKCKLAD